MSKISIRLPDSLHKSAREIARREKISMNQLITLALAEKISVLATEEYIAQRARRTSRDKFLKALEKVADTEPEDQDRI
jgi:hypothetical protein